MIRVGVRLKSRLLQKMSFGYKHKTVSKGLAAKMFPKCRPVVCRNRWCRVLSSLGNSVHSLKTRENLTFWLLTKSIMLVRWCCWGYLPRQPANGPSSEASMQFAMPSHVKSLLIQNLRSLHWNPAQPMPVSKYSGAVAENSYDFFSPKKSEQYRPESL